MSWFAAKTKFKGEFKALDFFKSIGVKSYVPYFKTKRVWSDRIKKVTVPAISGYVFFYLPKILFAYLIYCLSTSHLHLKMLQIFPYSC